MKTFCGCDAFPNKIKMAPPNTPKRHISKSLSQSAYNSKCIFKRKSKPIEINKQLQFMACKLVACMVRVGMSVESGKAVVLNLFRPRPPN